MDPGTHGLPSEDRPLLLHGLCDVRVPYPRPYDPPPRALDHVLDAHGGPHVGDHHPSPPLPDHVARVGCEDPVWADCLSPLVHGHHPVSVSVEAEAYLCAEGSDDPSQPLQGLVRRLGVPGREVAVGLGVYEDGVVAQLVEYLRGNGRRGPAEEVAGHPPPPPVLEGFGEGVYVHPPRIYLLHGAHGVPWS